MGLPLFYIEQENIDLEQGAASMLGADAKHLVKSLRARIGDVLCLGDGKGTIYRARIVSAFHDQVSLGLLSSTYCQPERPQVVLFQGMVKGTAMDDLMARAAESGVSRIVPFVARRSPFDALAKSRNRSGRWRAIARESSMLARRPYPLEVWEPLPELTEGAFGRTSGRIVLWEEEDEISLGATLETMLEPVSVVIVVGPEGGLDASEINVMRSFGVRTASLGALNLRAQSAGPHAAMILRYHYGLLAPERRESGE